MKHLPRDLSTFKTLITENYVYVDKTHFIYNLYATGDRYHFLSHPRRFGKSLLLSTLKELFSGNKDLFKDLWIGSSDYAWQKHPTIYLDFAAIAQRTPHDLSQSLNYHLDTIAQSYSMSVAEHELPEEKLVALVTKLSRFDKVVVLVDEYNYPLLGHLANIDLAEKQEKILKNFYGVLKSLDNYLHKIFITGVSKFSKSTIFAGINNLIDIGMSTVAEGLLGFTQEEIKHYFHDHIKAFAAAKKRTQQSIIEEMRTFYNGYQFGQNKMALYNPFAVLYYLKEQELRNYWYESGVPLLLFGLLKGQIESLDTIGLVEFEAEALDVFDMTNIPLITLLYQTGYLTIQSYNKETNKFVLDYPNYYVEEAFKKNVIEALTQTNAIIVEQAIEFCKNALHNNDKEKLKESLQTLCSSIKTPLPFNIQDYFYALFKFLFSLLDTDITSEVFKQKEIIRIFVKTNKYSYEFIVNFTTPLPASHKDKTAGEKSFTYSFSCNETPDGIRITVR